MQSPENTSSSCKQYIYSELQRKSTTLQCLFSQQCKPVINNSVLPILSFLTDKRMDDVTILFLIFFMHFCPGTMTTHVESINSDLQLGLDRRLRHAQH